MLQLKVFVNTEQIDELWIHNLGELPGRQHNICKYRLEKPVYDPAPEFYHERALGWVPLVAQVVTWIERHG